MRFVPGIAAHSLQLAKVKLNCQKSQINLEEREKWYLVKLIRTIHKNVLIFVNNSLGGRSPWLRIRKCVATTPKRSAEEPEGKNCYAPIPQECKIDHNKKLHVITEKLSLDLWIGSHVDQQNYRCSPYWSWNFLLIMSTM